MNIAWPNFPGSWWTIGRAASRPTPLSVESAFISLGRKPSPTNWQKRRRFQDLISSLCDALYNAGQAPSTNPSSVRPPSRGSLVINEFNGYSYLSLSLSKLWAHFFSLHSFFHCFLWIIAVVAMLKLTGALCGRWVSIFRWVAPFFIMLFGPLQLHLSRIVCV